MFTKASVLLAFATSVSAHMILEYPVPYGKDTLNSSPLAPGDYPCKQRSGVYDVTEMNAWDAGETKTISFIGSAVHGGGSCQFSLTTDKEPTESSQWKVIHSVEGGCPSNVTGNLEENAAGHGAATFPVTLPDDIPDGQYTFAWSWLNKVGNREFYMNCAPIKVGSGSTASASDASTALSSLPDMFVANLPDTSCSTTALQDFKYPNPGKSVVQGEGATLGDTLTGSGCDQMTKMGAGNGQISSPDASEPQASQPAASEPAASQPAATQPAASEPAASSAPAPSTVTAPGVFAPGASSAAASSAAATPAPSAPASSATPPTSGGNSSCTPCDNDGAVVCIGSSQFGLCDRGCAVAQDLAAGMSCANGAITRRSVRFPRAHLHRRHGSQMV